jgi:cell division protein FtsZ
MVDESLDDAVWVTVVATGFSDRAPASRRRLEEPAGEPRVQRRSAAPPARPRRGGALSVAELEIPEFIPRG